MSSVLFLSRNPQLRSSVEAVLTAAGHTVTTGDAAVYHVTDQKFDCAVVDSGHFSHELIAQLKLSGNRCIIGVYRTDREHAEQVTHGAIWCIPDIVDVADELKDGPLSVESAIGVSSVGQMRTGDPAYDRAHAGLFELMLFGRRPKGGVRAMFAAMRAQKPKPCAEQ